MNQYLEALKKLPREQVSLIPTPFHMLENVSRSLGRNIYIKRDDLTGFAMSGNKTRKFDFLLADAIRQGCDTMIGIGANQSNFCRILSGVGSKYGLDVHLVLNGIKPEVPTGNLRLDHILGATIHHIDTKDSKTRMNHALKIREDLENQGKKVYFMPPGGSTPVGTFGYAMGFLEIMEDAKNNNLKIGKIIHASSSAGTQAGLVLGQAIYGWEGEIHGISVDTPQNQLTEEVYMLARASAQTLGTKVDRSKIFTDDSYVGNGYGIKTPGCIEAVSIFAKEEAVFLDYVYTGKGAAGLIDYCRKGKIQPDENVVFLHTGGNIQLFE